VVAWGYERRNTKPDNILDNSRSVIAICGVGDFGGRHISTILEYTW